MSLYFYRSRSPRLCDAGSRAPCLPQSALAESERLLWVISCSAGLISFFAGDCTGIVEPGDKYLTARLL